MALRTRILTSLVAAPVAVGMILWLPPKGFALLAWGLMVFALWEWNRLTVRSKAHFVLGAGGLSVMAGGIYGLQGGLGPPALWPWVGLVGCLLWLWQWTVVVRGTALRRPARMEFMVGVGMLLCTWASLVWLRESGLQGELTVLMAVMVVWAADSFAYLAGRMVGRRRLAPEISPGKTVEGVVGGLAGALVVAGISAWAVWSLDTRRMLFWLAAAGLASLASVIGDLTVSRLKRQAGVKDSGKCLPGHGGLLDRMDGLMAAMPLFGTIWWWLR